MDSGGLSSLRVYEHFDTLHTILHSCTLFFVGYLSLYLLKRSMLEVIKNTESQFRTNVETWPNAQLSNQHNQIKSYESADVIRKYII